MRLSCINESGGNFKDFKDFKDQVLAAAKTEGPFSVAAHFGVDLDTALKYIRSARGPGGTYGEHDIDNKAMHRNRAPQNIRLLLKHFGVSKAVADKLLRFHIDNFATVSNHKMTSPPDDVALQQLNNGERLMALLYGSRDKFERLGYVATPVGGFKPEYPMWYVYPKENADVVREIDNSSSGPKLDLLHGLAFGYRMVDVFNFVRSVNSQLVDSICGNVDQFER